MTLRNSVALLLLAVPLAVSPAQPGNPPDDPDSWRVAGTAKVLCSALFVSGRDEREARANVSSYFLGAKLDSITGFQVDRQRKVVRLTLANRITREAKHYGDQGCVIHQPGRDSVYFRPVKVSTTLPDASTMPWPMGDVLPTTPIPSSIDTLKLRQAVDAAFANRAGLTAAFVVVHDGRIIAERYANGAHKDMQLESWSMGKSITGTLIGLLVRDGALRLEDPAPVSEWHRTANDPRAKIRLMDVMRMSSGLRFSRGSPEDIPGYHDHDLIYTGAIDAFQFAITRQPQFEPNTFGRYRNVDPMTLGYLIRETLRKNREDYLTWPQRALFDKIGIRRQVLETDPYGNFLLSGYDYGTARNWARLGLLYLNDGVWQGQRLLPQGFVKFVSTPAPAWRDSSYGGMVWVNARGAWRQLPRDAFAFRGAGGQDVSVVPSRNLVIVRMGHFPGSRAGGMDLERAQALLMEAIPPKSGAQPDAQSASPQQGAAARQTLLLDPSNAEWTRPAPPVSHLRFETTKGVFVLELIREWGPIGADRLYNLARLGYYDDTRFHRVNRNYIVQWGLHGNPAVNAAWKDRYLADDPPRSDNARGNFAFAFKAQPTTRNTQIYINLGDNSRNNAEAFTMLGRVIEGMTVIDSLYSGYGENSGSGTRQGRQGPLETGGNAFMDREYPLLDRIVRVTVSVPRR